MKTAYKLHGVHRHYDWGGTKYIPSLLGIENPSQKPFAEYWMGAHLSAPATVETTEGNMSLAQWVEQEGTTILGNKVYQQFGSLPYLYKVLDVAKMLSIQVHPTKENALIGFEKEEAAGIALDAANRNYKDKNHKPEVMVALSDFWLLHGFLAPDMLASRLQSFSCFHALVPYFEGANYLGLYQHFMSLSAQDADAILKPLMEEAVASVNSGLVDKSHPHWWAYKYYNGVVPTQNIDKGIFSIYILNIVFVPKYAGIFQGAGLLHAYLEGQNIELMANSDNVLRGGLTPKHVDIKELLAHVHFAPTYPNVLMGDALNSFETNYPCPVADFGLSKIQLKAGAAYTILPSTIEMLLVVEGTVSIGTELFNRGEVALLVAGKEVELSSTAGALLFRSFAP